MKVIEALTKESMREDFVEGECEGRESLLYRGEGSFGILAFA